MTRASYTLDVYGVDLHLATTTADWKRLRRRVTYINTSIPDSAGSTHFAVWESNDRRLPVPCVTFWIREELTGDPAELVNTCAHEAAHAASQILSWTHHDFRGDGGTDEPHAYLVGWLTQWLWQTITKEKR